MNDRELDMRVREAFDTLEVPDALRQRTLEAYDELTAAQAAEKPELHVISSSEAAPSRASRKVRRARLMSALAACLVLGLAVIGIFRIGTAPVGSGDSAVPVAVLPDTAVTAFVDIDINPSIELQLNDSSQVVAVEGMNEDGRSVLAGLALEGLSYEEALSTLMSSEAFAPYLNDDAFVQVSIASDNSGQERALMNASEQRLASLPCRGSCDAVGLELREEAHAHGMGCGRYAAALELSELDPDVTIDDCHDMSMRELRDRIAACHGEESATHGQHHRRGHSS